MRAPFHTEVLRHAELLDSPGKSATPLTHVSTSLGLSVSPP